jgi:myo-inositol-1(or 4)-monophosphatase
MLDADMTKTSSPSGHPYGPSRALTTDEERWLSCAVHMARAGKEAALPLYGTAQGRTVLGQGAGGDQTLELDRACESAIHEVLRREAPAPYRLVSEESGITGPEDAPWTVVVDPLDGSLNAKRGLEPFGASIAISRGGTLGDVSVGYVEDYTRARSFAAVRGAGLVPTGSVLVDPRRFESQTVELVLFEAGRPDRHGFEYRDLSLIESSERSQDMRIRQIGSLALSLCLVATGVADVLVAAVRSRSVDLAGGLLVLREAGGGVFTFGDLDIFKQPLDLEKRCAFVAWRAGLDEDDVEARALRLGVKLLGA